MMKNIFMLLAVFCFLTTKIVAQTTYDVFTYTEPKGYKKETSKDFISYTKTDNKASTYCIISLYAQTASSGDMKRDFENDWQELVVKPLGVKDAPKADNNDDISGWKTYSGAANFEYNSATSMALLTTAKNGNATANILVVTNAQSFFSEVDAFLAKLKMGKPKETSSGITKSETKLDKNKSSSTILSGKGIEGVWVSYTNRNILTDRVKFNWRIFFNNGKALLTIPDAGLYNFTNTTDLTNYWGTYNYNNKKGILKSGNNLQFTDEIKNSSSEIIFIQGEEYRKCKSVNGTKLTGSFSYYANGDTYQNKLPYGQNPKITFTTTGKFSDEGLFYQILKDYSKDDAYNSAGSGTYKLKDFSIILKYSDERIKQLSFTIPASETTATANLILIGRLALHKIK